MQKINYNENLSSSNNLNDNLKSENSLANDYTESTNQNNSTNQIVDNLEHQLNSDQNICERCKLKNDCVDIEEFNKDDNLKVKLKDNENCKICYESNDNLINFNRTKLKEENNNCEQLICNKINDQINETRSNKIDSLNNEIQQLEKLETNEKVNIKLNSHSIINKTIIDAKYKNDDFLNKQQQKSQPKSRLNLIRNFFKFKQQTKQSVLDNFKFKNQSNLDANLIESHLNNSISAPVLSTSNNQQPTKQQTMSTFNTNSFNQQSSTSASLNNNSNNNLIILKQTNNVDNPEEERETWSKKTEFLLAVIGFAVDLDYICYRNGGGAFLIPYLIMMLFGGLPLFYLELALGQYYSNGCLTLWKSICPMMKGIGYAICFIDLYMGMYYNTIISWALYYFCASFTTTLPWTECSNSWNTNNCRTALERSQLDPEAAMNYSSPAQEFFERNVLEIYKSSGIDDIGQIKPSLAICLACVFLMVYFSLWKGVRSTGKAVWFTAIAPYILLSILLVRGLTLDGSMDGIKYYLYPEWNKLLEINVWIDAATQTFFSLGPGFGTLLALSSYNKFNNNCYKDAILTSIINCLTSILSGFVIFSVLGFMAKMMGKDISRVAADGPGLVFIVYPEAISTMKFSWIWSLLFFLMLITLGLDSTFGGLEAMITGLCDEYPTLLRRNREIFVFFLILFIYVCALPTVTYGGNYIVNLLDTYGTAMSLLFVVLLESIVISWIYGSKKIAVQIQEMHGHKPGRFWQYCWRYISPVFLFAIFISAIIRTKGLELQKYVYPSWSVTLGWAITCSSMACVPIYAAYLFFKTEGTFYQRIVKLVTPLPQTVTKQNQIDKPIQPSEV